MEDKAQEASPSVSDTQETPSSQEGKQPKQPEGKPKGIFGRIMALFKQTGND